MTSQFFISLLGPMATEAHSVYVCLQQNFISAALNAVSDVKLFTRNGTLWSTHYRRPSQRNIKLDMSRKNKIAHGFHKNDHPDMNLQANEMVERLLCLELVDPSPLLFDFFLLVAVGCLPRLHSCALELQETAVVTWVAHGHATVCIDNSGAHTVQELSVVANNNHREVLVLKEGLQPLHALHVQVVSWLVEKKNIGIRQQYLAESDAHTPAPAEA